MFAPYMAEFDASPSARRHAPYAPELWQRGPDLDAKRRREQKFEERKLENELKQLEVLGLPNAFVCCCCSH